MVDLVLESGRNVHRGGSEYPRSSEPTDFPPPLASAHNMIEFMVEGLTIFAPGTLV